MDRGYGDFYREPDHSGVDKVRFPAVAQKPEVGCGRKAIRSTCTETFCEQIGQGVRL